MANLYWKEKKTDRDTTIRMLMDVLPDYTPSAFKVRQEGDDSGTYMCIYVERTEDKKKSARKYHRSLKDGGLLWCSAHLNT